MKLTKKIEAEIKKVMKTYWDSYLKGDLKTWASFLPAGYRNIGTTKEEIWNSKKDIVNYTKKVIDQMVGMAEMRNKKTQIILMDPHIMVHELGDMYIKMEIGWTFYSKFRLSSLLEKTDTGWKILHQHGSYPDSKTEEGETFAFDKISKENLELRDAVRRRTLELEQKNQELEIETALEKVRAIAMGMKQPADMLEVCRTISEQLELLGVKNIRNIQTAIINESKGTYLNYEYFTLYKTTSILEVETKLHPAVIEFVNEIQKSSDAFVTKTFKGRALKVWIEYRKKTHQNADPILEKSTSVNYYFYSIGQGALGISAYASLNDDEINLFRRFRNVFELAYRRFIDIELAIGQAKEARIETALERVRAVAMAMHKPDDLTAICEVLYKELLSLGFTEMRNTMINIHNDAKESFVNYDYSDEMGTSINPLFYNIHPVIEKQIKQIRKANDAFSETVFEGADLARWKKFRKKVGEKDDPRINKSKALYYYFYSIGTGSIGISTFSPVKDEPLDLLKRFRNVFSLAYQRYIDISLAEAQAREAKIEAALERVRSRSMGMQKSEELKEVIQVVYQQFVHLNINTEHTGFVMDYKERDDRLIWVASKYGLPAQFTIPYFDSVYYNAFNEAKKKGLDFFVTTLDFEEKNNFYKELFKHIPGIPAEDKNFYFSCPGLAISTVLLDNIGLYIENFEGIPYSDEDNATLMRFGKVFQQTYTRFLDLQKAEAQSREAQIELGLERVRARAMAMQHSNELSQLVDTVFKELANLDFALNWCIINIIDEPSLTNMVWAANPETNKPPESYLMKFEDYPFHHSMMKGYQERKQQHVYILEGKEKKEYDDYLFSKTEWRRVPQKAQAASRAMKRYVASFTFSNFGGLQTVGEEPLSNENLDILSRFGKVFDLTYTRFNDLQKAEAQAREAKIEAALERVRSTSLAMHKSQDLSTVVYVVFSELVKLDAQLDRCLILTVNPQTMGISWYLTGKEGLLSNNGFLVPDNPHPSHQAYLDGWRSKRKKWHYLLAGEEKKNCDAYVFSQTELYNLPDFIKADMAAVESIHLTISSDDFGCLIASSLAPLSDAHAGIVERFTVVFNQTYTRFLDLQKAEAQAREAKIEAALERTRTQSMIMQHSNELDDTLRVFHEQVQLLGINSAFSFLWLPDEANDKHIFWAIWEEVKDSSIVYKNKAINYPLDRNEPATRQCLIDWKSNESVFSYAVPPEGVENYFAAWQELIDGVEKLKPEHFRGGLYYIEAFMKYGCFGVMMETDLKEDEKKILGRIAIEFERTYTRFLDLQKAEAQAKEAQIETALEKVRSRTMAMQNSNELQETAAVLFNEFKKLGTEDIYQVTIGIYKEEEQLIDFLVTSWAGSGEQENRSFQLDMNEPTLLHPAVAAWKAAKKSLVVDLSGDALEGWLNYRNKMSGVTVRSEDTAGRRVISIAYFSKGHLSISTPVPPPQETIKTLERFATVFDGTYTRFLDLEKAEAQAREAKIEAALERVRSRTLAMHKSDELAETAAEVFHQLIGLGIDPNRLYIGIVNAVNKDMEMWATDEDGTGVGKKFTFNASDNESVKKLYDGWASKIKSVPVDMQGKELENYFHYLQSLQIPISHGLKQKRRVQSVAYFDKGFIGMASPDEQSVQNIQLLERFAAVFNLTFTRFNDLKIAEAHALKAEEDLIAIKEAKQKAEAALTELQATQKQLIQSEKMASLGELTAGIAHEIQNPLNFVNNFSEVSKELLDEIKVEMEIGNLEDAKEIMNDVIQNLEKINHHGKRADAIVKGMLQHSRSSSAVKEPTDINVLTDEYIRLCYHGLRAKDKSFNATIKTDFDNSIGNINIIPQDIGRVVLNLLTNAFYAAPLPPPEGGGFKDPSYKHEPTVWVSTKKEGNKVLISVRDNGPGIPQKVLDKIFQPFFTTKPTGQGTGLGLSLSYDIVTKGHGGELKVETKEGKGTAFIIQIPIN